MSSRGKDAWYGGAGRDHLTDFDGVDSVNGGRGRDFCLATFDRSSSDVIRGGPGEDFWYADATDDVSGVERNIQRFAE